MFGLFEQLGTVHAVLRFLAGHQVRIRMRERSGPGEGEVVWRVPHQTGLVNMQRNPAYAWIYAHGRSRTDRSRRLPGHEHSGRMRRLDAGSGWSASRVHCWPTSALAVRTQPGAAGRQPGPRRESGRAARRPSAAGRGGGLRDLRSPDAGELPDQPAGADRAVLLPAPPPYLRRVGKASDDTTNHHQVRLRMLGRHGPAESGVTYLRQGRAPGTAATRRQGRAGRRSAQCAALQREPPGCRPPSAA